MPATERNLIESKLSGRINKPDIKSIVRWAIQSESNRNRLYQLTLSDDDRTAVNALWCISHFPKNETQWLQALQSDLISRLLIEKNMSKKRIMLQLLRDQSYEKGTIFPPFLDYCLSKINSECESYSVRCFSIHCAFKMCRFYPELIEELHEYLRMLSSSNLSPGLRSAMRTTLKKIDRLKFDQKTTM